MIADRMLADLGRLWMDLGHGGEDAGVLRATSMTLIVVCRNPKDPAAIAEDLAAIMRRHPNRGVIVRLVSGAGPLTYSVRAQCWRPSRGEQQICSEHIEIEVGTDSLAGLGPILVALSAPDLPVNLWARCPRSFAAAEALVPALRPERLIADSRKLGEVGPALRRLSEAGIPVRDLAWTRITAWRQEAAGAIARGEYDAARVRTGAGALPPEALYMAGWLSRAIDTPLVRSGQADGGALELELSGPGGSYMVPARALDADNADLLSAELAIESADPVFEDSLRRAAALAEEV